MTNGVAVGLGTAAGVAAVLVAAWHGLTYWEVDVKCEKPKYSVVRPLGSRRDWLGRARPAGEVRRYAPLLIAEVTVQGGTMREALSSGFRQIAGFIFGKNVAPGGAGAAAKVAMTSPVTLEAVEAPASAKIAMTAPVASEMVGDGQYKVSFIMPSHYTRDTLPAPLNDAVKIREVPARTMAAMAWSGRSPSEEAMHGRAEELRAALAAAGLTPSGPVHLWQ